MVNLIKRMATVSVALILLCVCVVAQNEKSTKSVTDEEYGVIVNPDYVALLPGGLCNVTVITKAGYKNPYLIFQDVIYELEGDKIYGDSFTATILNKTSSSLYVEIKANDNNELIDSNIIYVRAMMDDNDYRMNAKSVQLPGYPIVVTVYANPTNE